MDCTKRRLNGSAARPQARQEIRQLESSARFLHRAAGVPLFRARVAGVPLPRGRVTFPAGVQV